MQATWYLKFLRKTRSGRQFTLASFVSESGGSSHASPVMYAHNTKLVVSQRIQPSVKSLSSSSVIFVFVDACSSLLTWQSQMSNMVSARWETISQLIRTFTVFSADLLNNPIWSTVACYILKQASSLSKYPRRIANISFLLENRNNSSFGPFSP